MICHIPYGGFLNIGTPSHPFVMDDHDLVFKPVGGDLGIPHFF